ncbi:MAG: ABC transporter ATP-binding protein [Oceanospirillaceae bacterium]
MSIVELKQVEKKYQNVHALQALDLSLQPGQVFGLFGHNGAGKTTVIKLILGLIEASSGQVTVFGENPTLAKAQYIRAKLGFLQENVSFYDQLSGLEVLEYFAQLKGIPKNQCTALLEQVGLIHACKRRVHTYSKGMRQRLGLAQALLGKPKLLLLDEPTVGLDPIATREFYQSIDQLKKEGCSIVLCSHVLPGVERYIDRALILGKGKQLATGSIKELREQAHLPATMQLQGIDEQSLRAQLQLAMPQLQQNLQQHSDGSLSLQVPMSDRMQAIRQLSQLADLQNLDIHLPSLEDLYGHFISTHLSQIGKPEAAL